MIPIKEEYKNNNQVLLEYEIDKHNNKEQEKDLVLKQEEERIKDEIVVDIKGLEGVKGNDIILIKKQKIATLNFIPKQ